MFAGESSPGANFIHRRLYWSFEQRWKEMFATAEKVHVTL